MVSNRQGTELKPSDRVSSRSILLLGLEWFLILNCFANGINVLRKVDSGASIVNLMDIGFEMTEFTLFV